MLEMAFAAVFVTVALVAIGGRSVVTDEAVPFAYTPTGEQTDLPCPWCSAQTREADAHCPTCSQPFG
jgi:hypothetical protein